MAATTYVFHRCLGRGGFGEVYLATRRAASGMERRVAVKVLRAGLENPEQAVKRLKDEAKALAVLDHPAVLRVIELTRIDGRIALVTEYVDGVDLSRFTRPEALLPERVVLGVMAEVAHALDVALTTPSPETGKPLHLVHRDIKPENIRLSKHGEVKLLDFGIARSEQLEREAKTATGHMSFTPGYTAPEAFLSLTQDAPADVFSLGASIYRLLAGERFFEGLKLSKQAALCASRKRFDAHIEERVGLLEEVHSDLQPLMSACLQWDPDVRPPAAEVSRRALRIADGLSGPTVQRWAKRNAMPPERDVEGAPFTGRTVEEDDPTTVVEFAPWPAPPPVPEGLVPMSPQIREDLTVERSRPGRAPREVLPPSGPSPVLVVIVGLLVGMMLAGVALAGLAVAGWLMM